MLSGPLRFVVACARRLHEHSGRAQKGTGTAGEEARRSFRCDRSVEWPANENPTDEQGCTRQDQRDAESELAKEEGREVSADELAKQDEKKRVKS
jgi:hypothetical protein